MGPQSSITLPPPPPAPQHRKEKRKGEEKGEEESWRKERKEEKERKKKNRRTVACSSIVGIYSWVFPPPLIFIDRCGKAQCLIAQFALIHSKSLSPMAICY